MRLRALSGAGGRKTGLRGFYCQEMVASWSFTFGTLVDRTATALQFLVSAGNLWNPGKDKGQNNCPRMPRHFCNKNRNAFELWRTCTTAMRRVLCSGCKQRNSSGVGSSWPGDPTNISGAWLQVIVYDCTDAHSQVWSLHVCSWVKAVETQHADSCDQASVDYWVQELQNKAARCSRLAWVKYCFGKAW